MQDLKIELIFRLAEAPALFRWMEVSQARALAAQQNRRPAEEQEDEPVPLIPEKQFLLTEAIQIDTNPKHINTSCKYWKEWLGNGYLWNLNHRGRVIFNHVIWVQYLREPPEPDPRDRYRPFGDGPQSISFDDY